MFAYQTSAQTCSGTVSIPPNGSVTLNGVGISTTSTGSVSTFSSSYTRCSGADETTVSPGSLWVGRYGSYSVTFDFDQPVNDFLFVINAGGSGGNENFIFTVDGAPASITELWSCYSSVNGNEVLQGAGAPGNDSGGGGFLISGASAYTQVVVTGNGGFEGGFMSICESSIMPAPPCNAGATAPSLSAATATNSCPTGTVNLNALHTGTTPSGTGLVWSTDNDSSDGLSSTESMPAAIAASGTYYAYYFDNVNNCYSPVSNSVSVTILDCCIAGAAAPLLSLPSLGNACPATTADLTTVTAINSPGGGAVLTWHTATPATNANKIATPNSPSDPTAVGAGTYYAAFYDGSVDCYSGVAGDGTTAITVTITAPCCGAGVEAPGF